MEVRALMTAHPAVHRPADRLQRNIVASALAHASLFVLLSILPMLFPPKVILIGTGAGGGRGGDVVRVGLTATDGGSGELFKPSLTPQPPAAPTPAASAPEEVKSPADESSFPTEPSKRTKKDTTPPRPAAAKQAQAAAPSNTIPRETGPGAGGAGRSSGSGGGFGGGQGVRIGTGSGGEGFMDSWYARQVEKRIGDNWLQTDFQSLAGRRLTTVIRFDILPDGRITNVVMDQRSGVTFYDVAAERAIRSSTPLPRPPAEFQGSAIRFVCYFDYPPEGR